MEPIEPKLDPRVSLRRPLGPPPGVPATPPRLARGTLPTTTRPAAAAPVSDGMWQEAWTARWARRAITFPGLFVLTAVHIAVLPLLLAYGLVSDLVRRRPLLLCRF